MKLYRGAKVGDVLSFPRKHSKERDYFRIRSLVDGEAELEAISKQDARRIEQESKQKERLNAMCQFPVGEYEGRTQISRCSDDPQNPDSSYGATLLEAVQQAREKEKA